MRRAVYAGSFDPPTVGHLWVIEQAAKLFDEVVVVTGVNSDKKTLFSLEERENMLTQMTSHLSNVWVTSVGSEYIVRFAASVGASYLIRGIRNSTDFEYEKMVCAVNRDLESSVLEVFLISPRELSEVSSSAVKALMGPSGWEKVISHWVSPPVLFELMKKHHTLWRNLVEAGANGDDDEFWETVLRPYFDSSRRYHTWEHFAHVMAEFERVKGKLADLLAVQFALALHDSVYDTHQKDNERQSADLAQSLAIKIGMSKAFAKRVSELVLCSSHTSVPTDPDAKLFCDIDLAILGASEAEFDAYEAAIKQEFSWVEPDLFRSRRRALLWGLLLRHEQGGIFLSSEFRQRYEIRAKKNLERSYQRLNA